MNKYCAVLMDVVSIQKYIFGSNRLKDNLGASHIIKMLFTEFAKTVSQTTFDLEDREVERIFSSWRKRPEAILLEEDAQVPFEIGMTDGGKTLMLFRDKCVAKKFMKAFTRELLICYPGIHLAVAMQENFPIGENGFKQALADLFSKLMTNRNRLFPATVLPSHGITAVHSQGGETINLRYDDTETTQLLPSETARKRKEAAVEEGKRQETLSNKGYKGYSFTNLTDALGQTEGDNYIAVVYIDGNNIGDWFKESTSLLDYRQRSVNMFRITEESYWDMIDAAVRVVEKIGEMKRSKRDNELVGFDIKSDGGKKVLPLRPIILGGDDLTFVCHGKLALYFTEIFINSWVQKANDPDRGLEKHKSNGRRFDACGGIAFAKTKAPFYRIYQFAEEGCSIAKKKARNNGSGSWIDFQLVRGTKSGNLEDIRKQESKIGGIELYYGPYLLTDECDKFHDIACLKRNIMWFKGSEGDKNRKKWAERNLKEFRTVLNMGKEVVEVFWKDAKGQGLGLPSYSNEEYGREPVVGGKTPYHDILEMMEYYPLWLIEFSQKGAKEC